jgi:predicted  nucleic acid-binding Zn-ribbon protein
MTADIDSLVLEHLRAIRADLADLKREVVSNTLQIAALGQQVAGLTTAVYGGKSDLEDMKRRVERLERRLELREG